MGDDRHCDRQGPERCQAVERALGAGQRMAGLGEDVLLVGMTRVAVGVRGVSKVS
uniref:hypothetical protein n=1 Tax=Saccharomonospora azurea TaxID=40988 RepID=UPI0002DA66B1|nr:hypothetical protein [Saccharomonospora azurea]